MKKIKLSICILSLSDRLHHLTNLLSLIYQQPKHLLDTTEILILSDNRVRTIGVKRNELLDTAKGDYIVFIDDDDDITPEYLTEVYKGIDMGVDAIGIMGIYAPVVGAHKPFKCSKDYEWTENPDAYYRSIQHICPIKTEIARSVRYDDINFTEDKLYADKLHGKIATDYASEVPIYYYKYVQKSW